MRTFTDLETWQKWRTGKGTGAGSIGFVPTMGALHIGHMSLFERARSESDFVVASIFVNPTQFNEANDFDGYPRDLDADAAKLAKAGVDALLAPNRDDVYHDQYRYRISETELATEMEGAFRPGHFDGVLTVVMKLLCLVRPDRAYFGEKDYQQYSLIRRMADAFFLPTEIIPCQTIREDDGLACSSRNTRLSPEARKKAPAFYHQLCSPVPAEEVESNLSAAGFEVEYVCDSGGRRYGAVRLDGVRLIDNVVVG